MLVIHEGAAIGGAAVDGKSHSKMATRIKARAPE